ncbi:CpsD/CapB family tyrosine-protein kinase [Chryseomicrobium aureum]|uniref:CpsD/CapB family tyrosine-protein kinase n=1 Tax=Chryseomicrobium aureum TaxID=1441723 RepID=UPI001957BE95|nr:CpsD/CapB family tyrosine-protein kinase [Chryseomicrobium aureum]MBM7706094.1 capsular exopolysaccharide synthesis family protein [Chryseomicrobium aureum]
MAKKKPKQALQSVARKLVTNANPSSVISEQFRTLRTNISFSSSDTEIRSLVFTSGSPGEGKSTVAANTAVVFAQEGKRVLLVDADMRKPTVHYTFHMTNTTGLSNLLTRQAALEDVVKVSDQDNLNIITCGPIPPNPSELLGSRTMDAVLMEMLRAFDVVIFDAPPVLAVTDAQIMANKADGTILVLNTAKTEKDAVEKSKELLEKSNANVLGVVMNNYTYENDVYYYQYYGNEE